MATSLSPGSSGARAGAGRGCTASTSPSRKRKPTLAQELALDKAMAARQTYLLCMRRYFACLPLKTLGSCLECHDGTPADPSSYIAPPATHQLAA
ncbi:hypothetical protein [Streptomyces sp. NPDC003480]